MGNQSNNQKQTSNKCEAFPHSAAAEMLLPEMLGAAMAIGPVN